MIIENKDPTEYKKKTVRKHNKYLQSSLNSKANKKRFKNASKSLKWKNKQINEQNHTSKAPTQQGNILDLTTLEPPLI